MTTTGKRKRFHVKKNSYRSLLDGLKDPSLREWWDIIKLQKHWIGDCTGTNIEFEIIGNIPEIPKTLTLWTDHPESIENIKFIAVSTNSILAKSPIEASTNVTTTKLLKVKARNPFTNQKLPIYLTSSIEFSPFRDDYLGIPVMRKEDADFCDIVGIPYEVAKELSAEEIAERRHRVLKDARDRNIGGYPVSPKLRDWLISRQRYWGTPIPIIHCESCGARPVPRQHLPVLLPKIDFVADAKLVTLREAPEWLATTCPDCGGRASRESDTMDTFFDSSWYFMRYIDAKNDIEIFSKEKASQLLPVDIYIGGKEHGNYCPLVHVLCPILKNVHTCPIKSFI